MEKEYYYKVVKKNIVSGEYYSAVSNREFKLTYAIGQVTTPQIGKVFIFKEKSYADIFKHYLYTGNDEYELLKVEVIGQVCKCNARLDIVTEKYVKMFWDSANNDDGTWSSPDYYWWTDKNEELIPQKDYDHCCCGPVPAGSYIADAVLPIESC